MNHHDLHEALTLAILAIADQGDHDNGNPSEETQAAVDRLAAMADKPHELMKLAGDCGAVRLGYLYHGGEEPPGEGWAHVGTGQQHGKIWEYQGQGEPAQQQTQTQQPQAQPQPANQPQPQARQQPMQQQPRQQPVQQPQQQVQRPQSLQPMNPAPQPRQQPAMPQQQQRLQQAPAAPVPPAPAPQPAQQQQMQPPAPQPQVRPHQALMQQDPHGPNSPWGPKQPGASYGGIVTNEKGQVLLRKAAGGYGGMGWTFASGQPDKGEHPLQTATREVEEETGHTPEAMGYLPGAHSSEPGKPTHFYMMRSVGENPAKMQANGETEATKWADLDEAHKMIGETPYFNGRNRDHRILDEAAKAMGKPAPSEKPITPMHPEEIQKQLPHRDVQEVAAAQKDWQQNRTRSAPFKSWFGDWESGLGLHSKVMHPSGEPEETKSIGGEGSVVRDQQGKPSVVYHGTPKGGWHSFDMNAVKGDKDLVYGKGFYFATDRAGADQYAKKGGDKEGAVHEVYLNIRKPFDMDKQYTPQEYQQITGKKWGLWKTIGRFMNQKNSRTISGHDLYQEMSNNGQDRGGVRQRLQQLGYDGITHTAGAVGGKGTGRESDRVWVAWNPSQIKSVQNQGTFDSKHPDIRLSLETLDRIIARRRAAAA